MKILIIGGNRFVGKLVAQKLLNNYDVTVINRKGTGPDGCTILKGDRNNNLKFIDKLKDIKFDIVIDMCLYNLEQCFLIDKLFTGKVSKYIFISSIASKMKGFGEYGINKKKCEKYLKSLPIPYVILQPTYIIGRDDHTSRLTYYIDKILNNEKISIDGKGNKIINFIDAEDMCDIICKLVDPCNSHLKNITYELSCNEYTSLSNLVWRLSQFPHYKIKLNNTTKPIKYKYNSPQDSPYINKKCFANNLNFRFTSFNDTLKKVFYEYKS